MNLCLKCRHLEAAACGLTVRLLAAGQAIPVSVPRLDIMRMANEARSASNALTSKQRARALNHGTRLMRAGKPAATTVASKEADQQKRPAPVWTVGCVMFERIKKAA